MDESPVKKRVWSTQVDISPALKDQGPAPNGQSKKGGSNPDAMADGNAANDVSRTPRGIVPKATARQLSRQKSRQISTREMLFSWRYVIVSLLHFSFVVAIQIRNCMPMALVCMVDASSESTDGNTRNDSVPDNNTGVLGPDVVTDRRGNGTAREFEFDWDKELQGLLLTSVSFLSFLGPVLVDFIRRYLGNKWTLSVMSVLAAVLNLLAPLAARTSPFLLMALRVVTGIAVLANLPITGDTCAWWGPCDEKQLMISTIFSGLNVGGIISSSLAGLLCQIPYDNGWPFVFYCFGGFSLLWTVAWHLLSSQKPEEHPFISEKEKDYIIKHRVGMESKKNAKTEKPPYRVILTSPPVIAFIVSGACHVWAANLYFTNLPFFFVTALGSSVLETGLLMSGIALLRFLGIVVWTFIVNAMVKSRRLPITAVRKITICTGFSLAGLSQLAIVFLDRDNKWLIVGCLYFLMLNQCVGACVVPVLPLDMAPKYAGFLTGIFFSFGSLVAISAPLIVSAATPTGSIEEWRTVWISVVLVYLMGVIVFALFGDATLQPWAVEDANSRANPTRVVSSFAAVGRRFSALFHSSPLTPASPVQGDSPFDFTGTVTVGHAPGGVHPVHQFHMTGDVSYDLGGGGGGGGGGGPDEVSPRPPANYSNSYSNNENTGSNNNKNNNDKDDGDDNNVRINIGNNSNVHYNNIRGGGGRHNGAAPVTPDSHLRMRQDEGTADNDDDDDDDNDGIVIKLKTPPKRAARKANPGMDATTTDVMNTTTMTTTTTTRNTGPHQNLAFHISDEVDYNSGSNVGTTNLNDVIKIVPSNVNEHTINTRL